MAALWDARQEKDGDEVEFVLAVSDVGVDLERGGKRRGVSTCVVLPEVDAMGCRGARGTQGEMLVFNVVAMWRNRRGWRCRGGGSVLRAGDDLFGEKEEWATLLEGLLPTHSVVMDDREL